MPFPLQIRFNGIDRSDALSSWIHEWAGKLERVHDQIESAEVVIGLPHLHHHQGKQFHVSVRVHVPGEDVIVDRDPGVDKAHEDPYVAVRDAFRAARRQLEEHILRRR
jgi:ribosome-associated translation inhibitor RaiA